MWHVQSGREKVDGKAGEDEEHPDVKALGVMPVRKSYVTTTRIVPIGKGYRNGQEA